MRKLTVVVAALAAVLVVASAAQAGCWATVGLEPLPGNVAAGETWVADVTVLQHGRTPMPDAAPSVLVRGPDGAERSHPAAPTQTVGRYRAEIAFPGAGRYAIAVHDGFPWPECAQTHTFGTFAIGAATPPADGGRGFPYWALGLGLAAVAALGLAAVVSRRGAAARLPWQRALRRVP